MFRSKSTHATTLALFCKVVDNYGDIGICWRLARQLVKEHGIAVTLWVDDLRSFQRMCPEVELDAALQNVGSVSVRHWRTQEDGFSADEIADIVIEFFGCDIPTGYVEAMAQCNPRPVWLNLEGLSAEDWVEGCHALPSMHPRLPLTKYFFFPGFTEKTGGLLHEAGLEEERRRFQESPSEVAEFLGQLGVTLREIASLKLSLFCYPHAPVSPLFDVWQNGKQELTCFVPEGVAAETVQSFLGTLASPGTVRTRGALTVRVLPFLAQPDYDKLLWSCDMNFVRGEDSFLRAQWAEKPFVWHIYPQDKNLHHVKLRAFLLRYCSEIDSLSNFSMRWNDACAENEIDRANWCALWSNLQDDFLQITRNAGRWKGRVLANGDLASNLVSFAASIKQLALENKV